MLQRPLAASRQVSAEETDACFIVRDANGQALAYAYCEDELASLANLN
jgi:hypothetical protein